MTPWIEEPVAFGPENALIGCYCRPLEDRATGLVTVFLNAGILHRVGPNRLYVKMARALASAGHASFRFDLSGIGDSGVPTDDDMCSLQDRVLQDLETAMVEAGRLSSAEHFVLVGLCSGADNALRQMTRDPRVAGSVLLDLNTHRTWGYYARKARSEVGSGAAWKRIAMRLLESSREAAASDARSEADALLPGSILPKDELKRSLRSVAERQGRLFMVFTGGVRNRYGYREQIFDLAPHVDFGSSVTLHHWPEADHVFSAETYRNRLIEGVVDWIDGVSPERGEAEQGDLPVADDEMVQESA